MSLQQAGVRQCLSEESLDLHDEDLREVRIDPDGDCIVVLDAVSLERQAGEGRSGLRDVGIEIRISRAKAVAYRGDLGVDEAVNSAQLTDGGGRELAIRPEGSFESKPPYTLLHMEFAGPAGSSIQVTGAAVVVTTIGD